MIINDEIIFAEDDTNLPFAKVTEVKKIKGKPKRIGGASVAVIFMVIGLVFAISGSVFALMSMIGEGWIKTEASVIDIRQYRSSKGVREYTPTCRYSVNGKDHIVYGNISSPDKPVIGDSCAVAYNPADPAEAKVEYSTETLLVTYGIVVIIGVFMVVVGIVVFIGAVNRTRTINVLLQTGQKVTGRLIGIGRVKWGNHKSPTTPRRLVVSADTGSVETKKFVSDILRAGAWVYASSDFTTNPIFLDVYMDMTDPSKYYVDPSGVRIDEVTQPISPTPPDFS